MDLQAHTMHHNVWINALMGSWLWLYRLKTTSRTLNIRARAHVTFRGIYKLNPWGEKFEVEYCDNEKIKHTNYFSQNPRCFINCIILYKKSTIKMVKEDFSVVPSNHATSDGRYSTLFRNTHSSAVEHWTKTITCLTIGMHQADGAWGSMQEALEVPCVICLPWCV